MTLPTPTHMETFALKFPDYPRFGPDLLVKLVRQVTFGTVPDAWLVSCEPPWRNEEPWLGKGDGSQVEELRSYLVLQARLESYTIPGVKSPVPVYVCTLLNERPLHGDEVFGIDLDFRVWGELWPVETLGEPVPH